MDLDHLEFESIPFIEDCLFVKFIDDLGYGVFSRKKIKKYKVVEVAPVVCCNREHIEGSILNYIIDWNKQVAIPLGWTMIYNHSDNNSCDFYCNYYNNLLSVITNREIEEGEQLTVNYGPEWFLSRNIEKIKI